MGMISQPASPIGAVAFPPPQTLQIVNEAFQHIGFLFSLKLVTLYDAQVRSWLLARPRARDPLLLRLQIADAYRLRIPVATLALCLLAAAVLLGCHALAIGLTAVLRCLVGFCRFRYDDGPLDALSNLDASPVSRVEEG